MSRVPSAALQITTSTPINRLNTPSLIDGSVSVDVRSAVDQFLAVFSTLNVLVSRRGVELSGVAPQVGQDENAAADLDSVESLFAVENEETDAENLPALADCPDEVMAGIGGESVVPATAGALQIPQAALSQGVVPSTIELNYQLNNLVFLGYISAVESCLRCLTRQLVLADEFTADHVSDQKISFGAALHSHRDLLPEAFLEEMTFISKDSVEKLLTQVIGIKAQNLSDVLEEYNRICQLRHCIVHRFGKLGTNNAIKLGLRTHKTLLEKPIQISTEDLNKIGYTLVNLVKAINNSVYEQVLERSAKQSEAWSWEFARDEEVFSKIYMVFASSLDPAPSPSCADAYDAFKAKCKASSASEIVRRSALRGPNPGNNEPAA